MKKLLLGALLLLSMTITSQNQSVKRYTSVISMTDYELSEWQSVNIVVVFNANENKDTIFYYENGTKRTFYQVAPIRTGETEDGSKYQIINVVADDDGKPVALQLFDDDKCLRVLIDDGYYVEFHKE